MRCTSWFKTTGPIGSGSSPLRVGASTTLAQLDWSASRMQIALLARASRRWTSRTAFTAICPWCRRRIQVGARIQGALANARRAITCRPHAEGRH